MDVSYIDDLLRKNRDTSLSKEQYRNLVELSPNFIFIHQGGKIVYANPKSLKTIGANHENEVLGKPVQELIVTEDIDAFQERLDKVLNGEKLPSFEYKVKTLDGRIIDIEFNRVVIPYGGKPAVMTMGKDITEEKKLDDQIEENKQRYQSLFEYNENSVFSFDLNGYFTCCNLVCEKVSGYSKQELLNRMHFNALITPEERERTLKYFELAKKGTPQNFRTSLYQKSGSLVHLNVTIVPIMVKGQVDGVYGIAQDITKQVEIEKSNEYLAFHDYLTGLPNRNMLNRRLPNELTQAFEKKQSMAVLFIDLDRFKVINDTLGHNMGDLLLKEVANRLEASMHDRDTIYRQGGDEFTVTLTDADRNRASKVARQIIDVLAVPFNIKGYEIFISPSIGISLFPEDGETGEILIKHADFAMYQAKKAGKNRYHFYSSHEHGGRINPLKMEMELHKAIERKELLLHYQPKINLKTGKITGVEALIRWLHPDWGMVSPGTFIPLVEETGLIIPIGEWALHAACKQNKEWQQRGFSTVVSVNLSPRQFKQSNLVQTIARVLQKTGLEPHCLEVEITESMTADIERTISTLQQLKKLGVRISIDDFGTGFSSLNYLKQLPVDTLKIDQSFVRELYKNPNDETIVKTIISMTHNLNLTVVAEGIESKEQLAFLQQHLCDEGQGYFFSKPLTKEQLEERIPDIQQIVKDHGISQDLNERMWAEELLNLAKKEMEDTVRLQQGMIFKVKKINGRFIHTLCDGELMYRLGAIPTQVVGKELHEFLPHESASKKSEYYHRVWDGEELVSYEDRLNGIHYLAHLRPIKRGGEVVEFIGSCVDITDRKQAEEALRESEYKYRLIAENMTDILTLVDHNGMILYASPSFETVLGFPSKHYEGKSSFDKIHPEDKPFVMSQFEQVMRTKSSSQIEYRSLHANGNWILVEGVGTPVIGSNGEVKHVIVVGRDITEKRKAEELLAKSEKLAVVGELAAGVAHEIRNPITSIKGFMQLFQEGMVKEEFFPVIFNEFNRIEEIIREFLTLAKPQDIQLKRADLKTVLNDVETLLNSEAHLQNVQLVQEFGQDIPTIMCDRNQIKQVFINLVKNGIEALPNGGFVKIQAVKEPENVLIKVIDNGMGISEERLQRLGEPFFSNKEKGTGLGLMLCFRIIRQHNGTIGFKSKKNQGTTVEVRLPISPMT
ncbi:PAS domain S-box protein [Niallia oryzisoli]|uniref:histidine kinase n=1 Tax=Niallia oryzisoli TaxID=1737571 RepID=A0ABZ2CBT1_9BACI